MFHLFERPYPLDSSKVEQEPKSPEPRSKDGPAEESKPENPEPEFPKYVDNLWGF